MEFKEFLFLYEIDEILENLFSIKILNFFICKSISTICPMMAPIMRYIRTVMSLFDSRVLFTPEIIMKRPMLSIIIFLILSFTLFPIIRPSILPARMAMKSVIIPIFFLSDTIFKKIIS